MSNTVQKFSSLSNTQYVFALLIGMATVLASMVVLTFDKHYNTPLINTTIFKIVSVIMLLFVGVVVFKERYDYKQIIGIMLVIVGGVLVFHKSDILTEAK
jgi:drug/metabolite transporter (DMT)-like permease